MDCFSLMAVICFVLSIFDIFFLLCFFYFSEMIPVEKKTIIIIIILCYGMFHVPGFIDGPILYPGNSAVLSHLRFQEVT